MKLHEWKTRIQSGEHLLGTMVTTFASADVPKILKACGFDFVEISIDETDTRLARLDWTKEERLKINQAMLETGIRIPTMC